ncbi:hypothetical protein OAQ84_01770, partial [Bdellovibrionales bacterium]|nr:hypothetical protein [Bdellovibrionales bacterium]
HLPKASWKRVSGKMTGGNLATVTSSMGSPFQAVAKGRIVCFEEVGERGHQIDRLLTQLTYSGYFKGARAIIFGEFLGGEEPKTGRPNWRKVLDRFAREQKIPVFSGMLIGHGVRQMTVPFFTRAQLDIVDGRGELTVSVGSKRAVKQR